MSSSEIFNRSHLAQLLQSRPVEYAYQLGYLDPQYAQECQWFGYRQDGELVSAVLVYSGLSRPALFTAGQREGIRPVLKDLRTKLPQSATGHFDVKHRDAVLTAYRAVGDLRRMSRMGLSRAEFEAQNFEAPTAEAVVLGHADTAAIMRLYAHWPDNLFEPYQLESGMYFGIRLPDGSIGAIAGIHNVSQTYDVAAIGNLVTHPAHRGKGYALAASLALLRAAFSRVGLVTLDVSAENEPAVRTYRRLGFREYAEFFEGELQLKV